MIAKVRRSTLTGYTRVAAGGSIKEINISQDIFAPGSELVEICFSGPQGSGVVRFSVKEIEQIVKETQSRTHLVKQVKVFKQKKDVRLKN